MRMRSIATGGEIGFILGFPLIALFYLGEKLVLIKSQPQILFDAVSRILPAQTISSSINIIMNFIQHLRLKTADIAEKNVDQIFGFVLFLFVTTLAGVNVAFLLRLFQIWRSIIGGTIGVLLVVFFIEMNFLTGNSLTVISVVISAVVLIAWSSLLGLIIGSRDFNLLKLSNTTSRAARRRQLLKIIFGSVVIIAAAGLTGHFLSPETRTAHFSVPLRFVGLLSKADCLFHINKQNGITPVSGNVGK